MEKKVEVSVIDKEGNLVCPICKTKFSTPKTSLLNKWSKNMTDFLTRVGKIIEKDSKRG